MSLSHSPSVVSDGILIYYDQANIKSYKGPVIQNMVSLSVANNYIATGYSSVAGTEIVNIPEIGSTQVTYNLIQNNYPTSNNCCPSLFSFNGGMAATPSTLYTYAIVYKCESGYTNANYMYRYEYTSNGGTLVTEGGVHNNTNRRHLGNGWYWAWGTFTTGATTNWLGYMGAFYYRYSTTTDKFTVAKVLLTPGNYTALHPKYWPEPATTRSNTQAIVDLTSRNSITATSLTYANDGTFSFNGSSNQIDATSNLGVLTSYTISFWARRDAENRMPIGWRGGPTFYWFGDNSWAYTHGGVSGEYYYPKPTSIPLGTWGHYCVVYNGSNVSIYRQGVFQGSQNTTGTADWTNGMRIGFWAGGTGYYWNGRIDTVSMYNRALSEAEIRQNFNALRGRFGL